MKAPWAGHGSNRTAAVIGHRTGPSSHHWQEIDGFAVTAERAWPRDRAAHGRARVDAPDLRLTKQQALVGAAPARAWWGWRALIGAASGRPLQALWLPRFVHRLRVLNRGMREPPRLTALTNSVRGGVG